ncbi:MAG TPA: ABC transporter permease [Lapillicoccus sp.]|jgi:lipooligosaccharide transport system permease protein
MAQEVLTPPTGTAAGPERQRPPAAPWRFVYEYQMRVYRRTWRGSLTTKLLTPFLFLLSMGVGLGSLVNSSAGGIEVGGQTVPYLLFVVPAILAVQCMSTGMGESSWPVLGAIKWFGTYHAMLATPARVVDILLGHCAYVVTMVGLSSAIFMVVAAGFGGFASWTALWCLPVSLLVGLAFATPVTALSSRLENDTGFNILFRLGQTPLMLFSGTFFPVSQLPTWLQPVAWVTPLWHGVEAERALALGTGSVAGVLGHVAALVGFAAAGWVLALWGLTSRLRP